jgi:hypothetical protein
MLLNGFKVTIPQGIETNDGYVHMKHGTQYTIDLGNRTATDADAIVTVDGKGQGKFRVPRQGSITLERPSHDTGRFTCYKLDSPEGVAAQLATSGELGLITVTFKPEKVPSYTQTDAALIDPKVECSITPPYQYRQRRRAENRKSAAGTGLSGTSDQKFNTVASLDYDESLTTTIHLRLVVSDYGIRPLTSTPRESKIPPPVSEAYHEI